MLIDASSAPLKAGTVSVNGLKSTSETVDEPASTDSQTPPPVVPTYK
jgi:hypothetical protein